LNSTNQGLERVGDVPYAWQQRRSSCLSGKTASLNSTNEGLAVSSMLMP